MKNISVFFSLFVGDDYINMNVMKFVKTFTIVCMMLYHMVWKLTIVTFLCMQLLVYFSHIRYNKRDMDKKKHKKTQAKKGR